MTESKVYELFTELMSECWGWAYDHPDRAVAYYDGAYTMALKIIENIGGDTITMRIEPPNLKNVKN